MSVSTTNWLAGVSTSTVLSNRMAGFLDSTKSANAMTARFLKKSDKDKNSVLTLQEIPGLSRDAFKKLDTDGDGKLSVTEIKNALKRQMDAIAKVFQDSDSTDTVASLQSTPEGQLMQAMSPRNRHARQTATLSGSTSASKLDVTA